MINKMIKLISISLISTKSITHSNNMPVVTRSAYNVRRRAMTNTTILEETCRLEQMCAICHDEIRGSEVFHLPCGHTFHKACLINQLRHGRQWATKCAVCRAEHREALLENSETRPFVEPLDQGNFGVVFTMMVPVTRSGELGGEQPPFIMWTASEGDDNPNNPNNNPAMWFNMMNEMMDVGEDEDEYGTEPQAPASEGSITADPAVSGNPQGMDEESDFDEIDYPDEEASPPEQTPQQEIQNEYLEVTSDDEEEGIHLYNTYVPYPRGYYRFTGNNQRR